MGLNYMGPFTCGFFLMNMYSTVNVSSLAYDFVNIFFCLAYIIVKIWYIMHITYKICVSRPFMLLVKLWSTVDN